MTKHSHAQFLEQYQMQTWVLPKILVTYLELTCTLQAQLLFRHRFHSGTSILVALFHLYLPHSTVYSTAQPSYPPNCRYCAVYVNKFKYSYSDAALPHSFRIFFPYTLQYSTVLHYLRPQCASASTVLPALFDLYLPLSAVCSTTPTVLPIFYCTL